MLKGLEKEKLVEVLNNLAVKELATSDIRWECLVQAETGKTHPRMNLEERLTNISIYRQRIQDYKNKANEPTTSKENKEIYGEAIELLMKLMTDDEKSDMSYQKDLYKKEHNIYNSRSFLEFPLDKAPELNALYDDFSGIFLFYDDISTLKNNKIAMVRSFKGDKEAIERFADYYIENEAEKKEFLKLSTKKQETWLENKFGKDKVDQFEALETTEEKIEFIKNNVEFTHCLLGNASQANWSIGVYGEMDKTFTQFNNNQVALPSEYSDFNNVTLAMTMKIKNNDLLQIMQSKIDIDKENLTVIDEKEVRGDVYRILKTPQPIQMGMNTFEYYIRYVCPSTGRVYHNLINETSISNSKFYKSGDPKSYIYAWWHINNGGDDPTIKQNVIRC